MKSLQRAAQQLGGVICLLFMCSYGYAQKSVQYENLTFEEAMAKAKKTNKIIFVDVARATPSPDNEKVQQGVFSVDSIANFFSKNCIAIKVDMGSEEGKKFAPRLAMLMYPVYVFHDSNGDQLDYTNSGTVLKDPSILMQKARASAAMAKQKRDNKRSIVFAKDNWEALLVKAKKENKMIFVDAYTTWCRPCIMMAKDIFTLDKVADYYNKNFINVTMDMEKGDGPALAKKYEVRAYPAFLYIDGDGNMVSKDGGYQEADKFIKAGETAVSKFAKPVQQASAFIRPMRLEAPGAPSKDKAATTKSTTPPEEAVPSAIHFSDDSWSAMLAEAKKTGKLIFIDAHTTWCGPCKIMRSTVFTQEKVGQLYNRNFVNAYTDMEKGEGLDLRKKYEVHYYPTFLFINGDGEVVHKVVGSCNAEEFMQHGLDAVSPTHNLQYFTANYTKNAGNLDFVKDYLKALTSAYEQKESDAVALAFLNTQKPSAWEQRDNWMIIRDYVKDANSPVFQYLVNNQATYASMYNKEKVAQKIYSTYLAWPINYIQFPKDAKPILDEKGYQAFLASLAAGKYEKKQEILERSQLTIYSGMRDWTNYAKIVNGMLAAKHVSMNKMGAEDLYSYANNISRFAQDNDGLLKMAAGWVKISAEDVADVTVLDKATYQDLYATLLEQTKQDKLAKEVRKKIDQQKLTQAQTGAPFQPLMRMK